LLDRGYYDRRFLENNPISQSNPNTTNPTIELKNVKVLIVHDTVDSQMWLSEVTDTWADNYKENHLLIIAEGFEDDVLEMALNYNSSEGNIYKM